MPQGDPRAGEKYLHFKNKLYQVISIAQHSETREKMVVYQALYGTFETYVRPFSMFVSPVDKEKYPQVKQKYRFQWVEFRKTGQESSEPKTAKAEMPKQKITRPETAKEEMPKQEITRPETAKEEMPKQDISKEGTVRTEVSGQKEPEKKVVKENVSISRMSVEEKMMAFFDADTTEEKYRILLDMRDEITDRMINNMAVVLDVVVEEGPLDLRYEELKACLRTMQRYECNRLR